MSKIGTKLTPRELTEDLSEHGITVFTKEDCSECERTKRILDSQGIKYTAVLITEDSPEYTLIVESGVRAMPQVYDHLTGKSWVGFSALDIQEAKKARKS